MRFKLFALIGALAMGGAALAQSDDNVGQSVSMDGPGIFQTKLARIGGELTAQQRAALFAPRGPAPGVYRLHAVHSGYCLKVNQGSGFDMQERIEQVSCQQGARGAAFDGDQLALALVPAPQGGHTIRTFIDVRYNGRALAQGQISNCLTSAPGVAFGPARIEARGCDIPAGMGWSDAGSNDQRFLILPLGDGSYRLQFAASNPESPDCVAARGGSREFLADFIRWGCNGNADQRFELEWLGPIPAEREAATLARQNWYPFADGHHRLSKAVDVVLSGASYANFETIEDQGDYCMKRCAELTECKAWTWNSAGYRGAAKPMCSWKREAGTASQRSAPMLGGVISGIVRP